MTAEHSSLNFDARLRRLRELVAAGIALAIILGIVLVVIFALGYTNDSERFARAKDLLQIIVPLATFVLGYYFNKTSLETRAENAESTAKGATAHAQQATEARNLAEAEARAAKSEAEEAKSVLMEVGCTAEDVISQTPLSGPGTLNGREERADAAEDPRLKFQVAWARAKRLLK